MSYTAFGDKGMLIFFFVIIIKNLRRFGNVGGLDYRGTTFLSDVIV